MIRTARMAVPLIALVITIFALTAAAQTTTATLRGRVTDESGNAFPGATVTANATATGYTHSTAANNDGSFILGGLVPGTYRIEVVAPSYKASARDVTLLIGQVIDTNFKLSPDLVLMEQMTVVGDNVAVETRTPTIATNVTSRQIESLPQGNRNFLNFAALAPGMHLSTDELRKEVSSGAQSAQFTNVFIDGVSFKNDVLLGGVVGQDSSRGNPFPQNAVQEFRVITQNFSAEYQKASSAVITAITKSGTNTMQGDAFVYFQDKGLVAADEFTAAGTKKPTYKRYQTGLSLGGPIVRDKLHFFASYEGNSQDRDERVTIGNPSFAGQFSQYLGVFPSNFRANLAFAKATLQMNPSMLMDWNFSLRRETDVRGFGGTTSFEAAENVRNDVLSTGLRHQWTGTSTLNEASLSLQRFKWNPSPATLDTVGREYRGLIRIGGRDTTQRFVQERIALRDDYNFSLNAKGSHAMKIGANLDFLNYDVTKLQAGNPLFVFISDVGGFDFPAEASYGTGNPDLSAKNRQWGIYAQDDWQITSRFTANLGVRYDYETNMLNNDYKTPAAVRQAFSKFFSSDYFTDGSDRPAFKGAIQPRLGFSFDLTGSGKTILFGGAGRYYDRVLYNEGLDERFRLQYGVRKFLFSADGQPRNGLSTIKWDPSYLSKAGLDRLIAQGTAPNPEVFLINNNTDPPYSNQFNIGVRQSFLSTVFALSYANIRSYNGFTYIFGNRNAQGQCCVQLAPGYSNVLLSSSDKETYFDGVYFTAEHPYTTQSRWGFNVAYTYGNAKQIGGDLFSLDYVTVKDYPKYATSTDERHHLVVAPIIGIPWDVRLSSILTYSSGLPFNIFDASKGFGPNEFKLKLNGGRKAAYTTVDLRLDKDFHFGNTRAGLSLEAFNLFNESVYGNYEGFIAKLPEVNAAFGKPQTVTTGSTRRLQVGLHLGF